MGLSVRFCSNEEVVYLDRPLTTTATSCCYRRWLAIRLCESLSGMTFGYFSTSRWKFAVGWQSKSHEIITRGAFGTGSCLDFRLT